MLQFGTGLEWRLLLGVAVLVLGLICVLGGWSRYRGADLAIRRGHLPARGVVPDLVVLGTVTLSVLLALALLRG